MAGKSLDEILSKMQKENRAKSEKINEQQKALEEKAEWQRKEWQKRNKIYELASTNRSSATSPSAGGQVSIVNYVSIIDTAWIYPIADLNIVTSTVPGMSPSIPFTIQDNTYIFPTLSDLTSFYDAVHLQSLSSQPNGNGGYSLGVGTHTKANLNKKILFKLQSGILVAEWVLMDQITNQSDLQVGGDSPNGTIGYGLIYNDWDLNGLQDPTNTTPPSTYTDVLRFKRV